jgi:hypothetical protein
MFKVMFIMSSIWVLVLLTIGAFVYNPIIGLLFLMFLISCV